MYGSMDDVTSKVAFAYAKQEAFVSSAFTLVVLGAIGAYLGITNVLLIVGSLVVMAGGISILLLIHGRKDLASINRPSLRVVGLVLLVALTTWLVAGVWGGRPSDSASAGLGTLLLLAAVAVSYPLPLRRGSTVLYSPPAVRELADGRTVALALGSVGALGLAELILPFPGNGPIASFFGGRGPGLALLALGVLGVGIYSNARTPKTAKRLMFGLLVAAGGVGLLLLTSEGTRLELAGAGPLVVPVLAFVVVGALSRGLNQGKGIVAHRA